MRAIAVLIVVFAAFIGSVGCSACDHCQRCRRCVNCRLDQACAGPRTMDDTSASGIRIESARYGRDADWVDVTPQVRAMVKGDMLVLPRDLHTALNVDPAPGLMKYIDMTVVIDGRVVGMTVGDSLHVTPLRLRAGGGGPNNDQTAPAATTRPTPAAGAEQ